MKALRNSGEKTPHTFINSNIWYSFYTMALTDTTGFFGGEESCPQGDGKWGPMMQMICCLDQCLELPAEFKWNNQGLILRDSVERNHYFSDFFKNIGCSKLFCETSLAWHECINNTDELQMQPEVEASPGKTLLLNVGKIQMGIDERTIKLCLHCLLRSHCPERMNCEGISSPFKMYYICIFVVCVCVCARTRTYIPTFAYVCACRSACAYVKVRR